MLYNLQYEQDSFEDENINNNKLNINDKNASIFGKITSLFNKKEEIPIAKKFDTSDFLDDDKSDIRFKKSKLKSHLNNLENLKQTSVFSQVSSMSKTKTNTDKQSIENKKKKKFF